MSDIKVSDIKVSEKPSYDDYSPILPGSDCSIIEKKYTKFNTSNYGTYIISGKETSIKNVVFQNTEQETSGNQKPGERKPSKYTVLLKGEPLVFDEYEYMFVVNKKPTQGGGKHKKHIKAKKTKKVNKRNKKTKTNKKH